MKITITTDEHSKFLMFEALSRINEYEQNWMISRNSGASNSLLYIKEGTNSKYRIAVWHSVTKTIHADVKLLINK
jgi:hypothetical protein